jgi:hypothetical protein
MTEVFNILRGGGYFEKVSINCQQFQIQILAAQSWTAFDVMDPPNPLTKGSWNSE